MPPNTQNLSSDDYANMMLTIVSLSLLAVGTLAMFVRWYIQWKRERPNFVTRFREDIKRGKGFTFYRPERELAAQEYKMLGLVEWLHLVNERPDQVPHVGIEGATGTGKTTLAEAIVTSRSDLVIIVTAKPDEHEWGGLPFVTIDDDGSFTQAEATLKSVLTEVTRRLVATKKRESIGGWLTVALDDFTRLRQKCLSAGELIELVGDQGRSIRVRLILLSRSKLVKALGIDGQGDWRDNLVFISLDRQRRATLEWDGTIYQLDTRTVQSLTSRPISQARWWQAPEKILSRLFASNGDVPVHASDGDRSGPTERTGTGSAASTEQQEAVPADEEQPQGVPAVLTPDAIRTLYTAWGSKNKIAAMLTGTKSKRLEQIDRALRGVEEETPAHR